MNDFIKIPSCNITASKLTQYWYNSNQDKKGKRNEKSIENLKDNRTKGEISHKSGKKMEKIINNWYSAVYFDMIKKNEDLKKINKRFGFVTLTLSGIQQHDDAFCRRHMLAPFIQELKRKFKIINYLHCSEAQKNGNIHFHILIDKFVKHQEIRDIWNKIQAKFDYIDNFEKKHGHRNPNSTDIHSLNNINNIPAYLVKYFTKTEDRRVIDGRLWGYSDNLKKIEHFNDLIDNDLHDFIGELRRDNKVKCFFGDYFSLYEFRDISKYKDRYKAVFERIMTHYLLVYDVITGKIDKMPDTPHTSPHTQSSATAPKMGAGFRQACVTANAQLKLPIQMPPPLPHRSLLRL